MARTEHVYIDDYLQNMNIMDVYEVEAPLVEELKNLKKNTKGEQLELFTTKTEHIQFDDYLRVLKVHDGK